MAGRTAADVKYPACRSRRLVCMSEQLRGGNSRRHRHSPEYNDADNGAGCGNDRDSLAPPHHIFLWPLWAALRCWQCLGFLCEEPDVATRHLRRRAKEKR